MGRRYTIGQLARAASVPTTTVRYYERRRLLHPTTRSGSGDYRIYGEDELERLCFIRAAQGSGFALDDIAALLLLREGRTEPCGEVQELLESRLGDVTQRLVDLQHVERVLRASLKKCRQHEREGRCEVIDILSLAAGGKRRPHRS
jgi:DNA-binding transcriptional MerR regulator